MYFVYLRTKNNADAEILSVSPPILIDLIPPVEGHVKDGLYFTEDLVFQGSTHAMEGSLYQ